MKSEVNHNGWTDTRPSAEGLLEGLLKVPLAESDPFKNGIRMGGQIPDLYVALSRLLTITTVVLFSSPDEVWIPNFPFLSLLLVAAPQRPHEKTAS